MIDVVERDYESVSAIWGGCNMSLLVLGTIFSMICAVFFHILFAAFDFNCILNPKKIVLVNLTDYRNHANMVSYNMSYGKIELPVDFVQSQWASSEDCFGSLYNPILSVIFGIVWLTFFLMCSNGGRSISGLTQPWKIVLPCSIFTFVYSIVCLVTSSALTEGLNSFNSHLRNVTGPDTAMYRDDIKKFDTYVSLTIASSWIYTACWILSFLVLILRCCLMPDFKVVYQESTAETKQQANINTTPFDKKKLKGYVDSDDDGANEKKSMLADSDSPLLQFDEPSTSTTNTASILVHVNIEPEKPEKLPEGR